MKISKRGDVAPFIAMDVMEKAQEAIARGESVIRMEVGQPGTAATEGVLDAARQGLEKDVIGYTGALGIQALRERIAAHYKTTYGLDLSPSRVIVTSGSSGAFTLTFTSLFETGDNIGMAIPWYPAYPNIIKSLGLNPIGIETKAQNGFQPTTSDLADQEELDGLIIASPANPTGTMLSPDELEGLIAQAQERGITFISNEIYHGLTYGKSCATALQFSDDVIVVNSFSKYYSMPGWRIGWMIVPEELARPIEKLAQSQFISPNALSQIAACAAFDCDDQLQEYRAVYEANRDHLLRELTAMGLSRIAPADGAFYLYVDVSDTGADSTEFCARLLAEEGVAITPGHDFDPVNGGSWVRISYAGTHKDICEATARLKRWLGT